MKSISDLPPGLAPEDTTSSQKTESAALSKNAKKKQKRKEKKQQEAASESIKSKDSGVDALSKAMANAHMDGGDRKPEAAGSSLGGVEVQKRLRALKKKMKEIDNLQAKIDSGEIKDPEKNQLDKLAKREQFEAEIEDLEAQL